jgi:aldehyde dehydrogenase (NAD(P)+)
MTAAVQYPKPTEPSRLDAAVRRLREGAVAWARAPIAERIALARSLLAGSARVAERSVAAACAAKGIPAGSPLEGEEWLSGPYVNVRLLRQVVRSLRQIARNGNTAVGPLGRAADGRLTARVFPASRLDAVLFMGARGDVHFQAGVGEEELNASRARFYKEAHPRPRVCLILGAGNVNSIPSTDVVTKLFVEGAVCLLKTNPVNAYVGPFIEEAFAEAISRGFLQVVYGGAEEGSYLTRHPGVDEVHITGSDRTHDLMVWGPPGPERAERVARGQPLLQKTITSELGNVTPVLLVPGPYTDRQLAFQADSVAGMVTNNASFNCIAGKMLLTPRGWARSREFVDGVERFMGMVPARKAWYPGAEARFQSLTEGRTRLRRVGGGEGALPWTILPDLDVEDRSERAFRTEPFCSILSEAPIGSGDPVEFLEKAVAFCNERLWGTLSAALVVHPSTLADPATGAAVERAIGELRYGTVCVNVWPGLSFALGTTPWGAAPGAPLHDIQSGRGWVHNTLMLEHVDKVVLRHPVISPIKLPYFASHRTAGTLGRRLVRLEQGGNLLHLPGVVAAAARA